MIYSDVSFCHLRLHPLTIIRFICDEKFAKAEEIRKKSISGKSQLQWDVHGRNTAVAKSSAVALTQDDPQAHAAASVRTKDSTGYQPSQSSSDVDAAPPVVIASSTERSAVPLPRSTGVGGHAASTGVVGHAAMRRVADHGSSHGVAAALDADTSARLAAVEARTSHARAQLDQMLSLMELKDKEIEGTCFGISPLPCVTRAIAGKLKEIELQHKELSEESRETNEVRQSVQFFDLVSPCVQSLIGIFAIWDEKRPMCDLCCLRLERLVLAWFNLSHRLTRCCCPDMTSTSKVYPCSTLNCNILKNGTRRCTPRAALKRRPNFTLVADDGQN